MALILDLAAAAILIMSAITGWHKGFLRYLISSVGTIAAIIIAFLLADIIAPTVYEKWIQPSVKDFIGDRIQNFDISEVVSDELKRCGYDVSFSKQELNDALRSDGDISEAVASLAEKNGESSSQAEKIKADMDKFFETRFTNEFNEIFKKIDTQKLGEQTDYTKVQAFDVVRSLADNNTQESAEHIGDNLVNPFFITGMKIFLTFILFVLLSIIIKILFTVSGVFNHIPVANGVNRFFGLIAGVVKGGLYLIIIAFGIGLFLKSAGDSFYGFNTEVIKDTLLFRHLFYLIY